MGLRTSTCQGPHSSDSSAPSSPRKRNAEQDYMTRTDARPDPRLATRQAENLRRFAAVCTFFLQTGQDLPVGAGKGA